MKQPDMDSSNLVLITPRTKAVANVVRNRSYSSKLLKYPQFVHECLHSVCSIRRTEISGI